MARKRYIVITTAQCDRQVAAKAIGTTFAVTGERNDWRITHIRSGRALPGGSFKFSREALRVQKAMEASPQLAAWQRIGPDGTGPSPSAMRLLAQEWRTVRDREIFGSDQQAAAARSLAGEAIRYHIQHD